MGYYPTLTSPSNQKTMNYTLFSLKFFKIIGLGPWDTNITCNNTKLQWALSKSPFGSFYNILLILSNIFVYVYLNVYDFIKIDYVEIVDNSSITRYVYNLLAASGNITLVVTWLNYLLQQDIFIRRINQLSNVNINLNWERNEIYDSYGPIFLGYFLLFIIEMAMQFRSLEFSMQYLYWLLPYVINTWMLVQYTLMVNGLLQRFKNINLTLLKKFNCNDQNDNLFPAKLKTGDFVTDVVNIRLTHKKVYEISQGISDFFAIPILVAILYFCASVIITFYFMLLILIKEDYMPSIFHLENGFWIFMVSGYFVALATVVTKTVREFNQTADGVHLVLERCIVNPRVKKELVGFSRDLLHRNLEFSTYGIVSLDGSLIHTMFGTIVTYLIILIQFRLR